MKKKIDIDDIDDFLRKDRGCRTTHDMRKTKNSVQHPDEQFFGAR